MNKRSKLLSVAKFMPPQKHTSEDRNYDIRSSDVVKWMMRHPYAWEYIWNAIKQSGAIVYDKETGMWHGVDYEAD